MIFKDIIETNLKVLFNGTYDLEEKITEIKVAVHHLEQMQIEVNDLYKIIDSLEIELKRLKDKRREIIVEYIKEK